MQTEMITTRNDPKRLAELIDRNFRLPTIPLVASRALTAIADQRTSAHMLADIVAQDQGLTTRMLSVANSVAYCPVAEIQNIHQAAVMLGFKTMENLIVAASYRAVYKRFGQIEKAMWEHSVACGLAAQAIAEQKRLRCVEEAFVAGLMHDVGRVVMNNGERDKLAACLGLAKDLGISASEAEQELFGFTHAEVGALLISRWSLSQALHDAILLHHDPESAEVLAEENLELCQVTSAANRMVHLLGIGSDKVEPDDQTEDFEDDADHEDDDAEADEVDDPTLLALGITPEDLGLIEERVRTRFETEQRSLAAA